MARNPRVEFPFALFHPDLLVETGEVPLSRTMQTSYGPGNSKPADEIEVSEAAQLRKTDLKQVIWGMESGGNVSC
jgi:hypothetical protein